MGGDAALPVEFLPNPQRSGELRPHAPEVMVDPGAHTQAGAKAGRVVELQIYAWTRSVGGIHQRAMPTQSPRGSDVTPRRRLFTPCRRSV